MGKEVATFREVAGREIPRVDNAVCVLRLDPGECALGMAHFLDRLMICTNKRVFGEFEDDHGRRVMQPIEFQPLAAVR